MASSNNCCDLKAKYETKKSECLDNQLRTALETCAIKLAHLKILDFYELTSL